MEYMAQWTRRLILTQEIRIPFPQRKNFQSVGLCTSHMGWRNAKMNGYGVTLGKSVKLDAQTLVVWILKFLLISHAYVPALITHNCDHNFKGFEFNADIKETENQYVKPNSYCSLVCWRVSVFPWLIDKYVSMLETSVWPLVSDCKEMYWQDKRIFWWISWILSLQSDKISSDNLEFGFEFYIL